ncbi:MAG: hypothetical protein A3H98_11360 [Bacteroidetes bacterium RIFCSPLOWO2_02_FULL_36_8]|nr:MAG: hypothetical protein A3H98_11360 [Bacteroidetes bacterium RIFCSPLOWO2_02_FULL_36_8]OFY69102.1 MAG: hypothetical protein A3G23_06010 [Bacteroidetes bacterium RIFCSPLOWO2_12_FULL_37_12]
MTYEEYLSEKKIDPITFKESEPVNWEKLKQEYDNSGSVSFTLNKKFLLNLTRRKYRLKEKEIKPVPVQTVSATTVPARKKPVMR